MAEMLSSGSQIRSKVVGEGVDLVKGVVECTIRWEVECMIESIISKKKIQVRIGPRQEEKKLVDSPQVDVADTAARR